MSVFQISRVLTLCKDEELNPSDEGTGSQSFKYVDRFTVDLPHAGAVFKVKVLYDLLSPENPPDFIPFDQVIWDVPMDFEELVSLWKPTDVRCIHQMLMRIKRAINDKFSLEVEGCKDYISPNISFMFDVVKSYPNFEVRILNKDFGAETLYASLPIEVSARNESCTKPIYLHLKGMPNKTFSAELEYPKWMGSMFSQHTIPRIFKSESPNPIWEMGHLQKLIEYVKQFLNQKLRFTINGRELKQAFLQMLCDGTVGVPLEVDTSEFSRLLLHYELQSKNSIEVIQVTVRLPDNFPAQPPSLKMRNQKILTPAGTLKERIIPGKAWNPEMDAAQMSQLFKQNILTEIDQFAAVMYRNDD